MKYCAYCGSEVHFGAIDGDHLPRFHCPACLTIHYQNPRVIVGCIPVWENKIVLCRRGIEPQYGFWNIPGGFLENGEPVEIGAAREAHEEAGLRVNLYHLQSVFTVPSVNQVHLHFLCQVLDNQWFLTSETTEIQLFAPSEIPWHDIAFASNRFALKAYIDDLATQKNSTHMGSYDASAPDEIYRGLQQR